MGRWMNANVTFNARKLEFALTRGRTGVMIWRSWSCVVRERHSLKDGEYGRTFHRLFRLVGTTGQTRVLEQGVPFLPVRVVRLLAYDGDILHQRGQFGPPGVS